MDNCDEYAKLVRMMNAPRVVIDNETCKDATIIRLDSVKRHGTLLRVVQAITDLNLVIKKAYISSDGSWSMDVFNVTDYAGNKISQEITPYIQKALESDDCFYSDNINSIGIAPTTKHTSIELTGTDRPGLMSDVCTVLANLNCKVTSAHLWTHKTRISAVVHITDGPTGISIRDKKQIKRILTNVFTTGETDDAGIDISVGITHRERQLHQMTYGGRDFDCRDEAEAGCGLHVTVSDCAERCYTMVTLRSKDRAKLLADTVCMLTDMQYVVYHGMVNTGNKEAYQEYYIRHVDGNPINSEAEKERLIRCLKATIQCSTSEELELELRTIDRVGLLSDITRIFWENGLTINRAKISTYGDEVVDTFYLSEISGNPVGVEKIETIRTEIGQQDLVVKHNPFVETKKRPSDATGSCIFLLGNHLMHFWVVIDNETCKDATIIRLDSVKRHGTLLRVVQAITDLNLVIKKAYISSDGSWSMDVFNVTDYAGNKISQEITPYIQKALESDDCFYSDNINSIGIAPTTKHTSIELTGTDRPGLMSDVCTVLANLNCKVTSAHLWTHKTRISAVVHITDGPTGISIRDKKQIKRILTNVFTTGETDDAGIDISVGITHRERQLHQMTYGGRDFDCRDEAEAGCGLHVTVSDCAERCYTMVTLRSKDRAKLLADTVCMLTDMQYVVYHGMVNTGNKEAYQEYYIRHVDGNPINSEAEKERLIRCLKATIQCSTSEELELELRTIDRVGLLSDITRIFWENGLTINRAKISTYGDEVVDTFYLSEISGNPVGVEKIETIRTEIGQQDLVVKHNPFVETKKRPSDATGSCIFLLGNHLMHFW